MKSRFDVTGMTCSACSAHVEKAVAKVDGVNKVTVSLLTNSMTVEFDESKTSLDAIISAVVKAGYNASTKDCVRPVFAVPARLVRQPQLFYRGL